MNRNMGRSTHTYAGMEISAAAYKEIAAKLKAAGYDHVFDHDTGTIDMSGIGLMRDNTKPTPDLQSKTFHSFTPEELAPKAILERFGELACDYSNALIELGEHDVKTGSMRPFHVERATRETLFNFVEAVVRELNKQRAISFGSVNPGLQNLPKDPAKHFCCDPHDCSICRNGG